MQINLPSYEDAVHFEHKVEYGIDWEHGAARRYKRFTYGDHWRVYEGGRYRFMHSGLDSPDIRDMFARATGDTAEIALSSALPRLYTWDGTQVTKKHTYPQTLGWTYNRNAYGQKSAREMRMRFARGCLLDYEFGIALPMTYSSTIYLPYRTAQPLVTGAEGSFLVYSVTRAIQKEYKARVAYVTDRARAIIAVMDDSKKVMDIALCKLHDHEIAQGFMAGRFDHWTTEMYLRAHADYVHTQNALYDISPSERHQRLYLDRGPR